MIKIMLKLFKNFKKWLDEPSDYEKKRKERFDTIWYIQNQAQKIMDISDDKRIKRIAFQIKCECGKLW